MRAFLISVRQKPTTSHILGISLTPVAAKLRCEEWAGAAPDEMQWVENPLTPNVTKASVKYVDGTVDDFVIHVYEVLTA